VSVKDSQSENEEEGAKQDINDFRREVELEV
jgi:hypothetical protein